MLARFAAPVLNTIYPPRCMVCSKTTASVPGLCADCWRDVGFITGAICECCGMPVPGDGTEGGILCDSCVSAPPAWDNGSAVFVYSGAGQRIVLALKHADRLDMVPQLARWMLRAGAGLAESADLIAPVPLHWRRMFRRRYNQSAELARQLARIAGRPCAPDLLVRTRATPTQHGKGRAARHENVFDAFALHRRWRHRVSDQRVLLVDDVMTSGATLSACAEACRNSGATRVDVCVLARVAQRD